MMKNLNNDYHKYVISNGKLIGDFEEMYKYCDDPWKQSQHLNQLSTRVEVALIHLKRLREDHSVTKVLEIGCGFGHLSAEISHLGFEITGLDFSPTAIEKAKTFHPNIGFEVAAFDDIDVLHRVKPDVIIMSEITWYVLDKIPNFLRLLENYAETQKKPIYLIHLLATYKKDAQKYGTEYFTDLAGMLNYFNLEIQESGFIREYNKGSEDSQGTFFIAKI
jgi:2-polyprenyl-3-methyl-5-hydroxy-6-metoxy-1,4-benzoquinol methylase